MNAVHQKILFHQPFTANLFGNKPQNPGALYLNQECSKTELMRFRTEFFNIFDTKINSNFSVYVSAVGLNLSLILIYQNFVQAQDKPCTCLT